MSSSLTRRRLLSISTQTAAAITASRFFVMEASAQSAESKYPPVFSKLDQFVKQYMLDMNSPGLTLVLADGEGVQRVVTYGFSDKQNKVRVKPDDLFQIGSISKSFVALCLLQLRDEGKLDLNKPITDYLPCFRIDSTFAPITVHHLLTHSSGLPASPRSFSLTRTRSTAQPTSRENIFTTAIPPSKRLATYFGRSTGSHCRMCFVIASSSR